MNISFPTTRRLTRRGIVVMLSMTGPHWAFPTLVHGATATWDGGGTNGSWGTPENWNPDGVPTFNNTLDVEFPAGTTQRNTFLGGDRTVRSLRFTGNTAIAIRLSPNSGSGSRNLTFDSDSAFAEVFVDSGVTAPNIGNNVASSGYMVLSDDLKARHFGAGTLTFSRYLSGAGGVIIDGGSTQTVSFTDANTYTGNTTISSGTLALGASGSINNSPVIDVNSGATFNVSGVTGGYTLTATQTVKGTGTVSGGMIVAGTIAPGNSVGTLNTGNLTLAGTYEAEIDWNNDLSAAPNGDLVNVTGTVNLSGTLKLVMLNASVGGVSPTRTVVLIRNDGTDAVTGTFGTFLPPTNAFVTYSIDYAYNADGGSVGNDVAITISHVPEPASLSLLALGALGLRRRRT